MARIGNYKGVQIDVNESGLFSATVNDLPISCNTLQAARDRIDELLKAGKRSVSIPVVGILRPEGYRNEKAPDRIGHGTFVGWNRNSGEMLIRGVEDHHVLTECMPDAAHTRELLARVIESRIATKALDAQLKERVIKCAYGRIKIEEYDDRLIEAEKVQAKVAAEGVAS